MPFRLPLGALVLCCLIALPQSLQAQRRRPNPAFAKVVDQPDLPRVLVIGDSISIGYTEPLQQALKGKANVHRIPQNGGPTTLGLAKIDEWLGDSHWDLIHFNWGLHDLKYMDESGKLSSIEKGHQQVPIKEYDANLRKLVKRLKETGAVLVWRNTTPIPEGSQGRVPGDEVKYNAVAKQIMEENGIAVEDQYSFVKPQMDKLMRPANVHFTEAGYQALADHAAAAILKALQKKD